MDRPLAYPVCVLDDAIEAWVLRSDVTVSRK